jgi:DNA-binding NarL/FixJ family response regulator
VSSIETLPLNIQTPIQVVVGEDQPILRAGLVEVLTEGGLEVVGTAGEATDLVRKARALSPDVVVTDIQMPPGRSDDGLRAALEIRATQRDVGVLVLSQFLEDRYVHELLGDRAEGVGYLLKDRIGDLDSFVEAVRRVAGGGCVLDTAVVARLMGRSRTASPVERLTPREGEVLGLMAQGLSNHGVADALVVTVPAVERHITSIFDKLELRQSTDQHRRVLAVLEFLRG